MGIPRAPRWRNATVVKLLNWTVVGRLGHELATINCPHVVSGAGDCDRAMGPCVGRRANFECILIDGGASPARGCGQAGAGRWAACGRDQGTRKAGLSSQISPNRDAHSVMTLALEPACGLGVIVMAASNSNPPRNGSGLLGPGAQPPPGPSFLGADFTISLADCCGGLLGSGIDELNPGEAETNRPHPALTARFIAGRLFSLGWRFAAAALSSCVWWWRAVQSLGFVPTHKCFVNARYTPGN